ncbi:hypothetical protein HOY80DRAFT_1029802 [Tuber brumale]|nr:hypothetical protein HOY80DRAFT_1029802 [Tuber brumale]
MPFVVMVLADAVDPEISWELLEELSSLGDGGVVSLGTTISEALRDCSPTLAPVGARCRVASWGDLILGASLQMPKSGVAEPMAQGGVGACGSTTDMAMGGGASSFTVSHPQPESGKKRKNKK